MTEQAERRHSLTMREALAEFGWLPLLLISVGGGLSVIDIAEKTLIDGLSLTTPFQVVLDGYGRITNVIAAAVEPLSSPLIGWLREHWRADLELQPFWRPLFVLGLILISALARAAWRQGAYIEAITQWLVMSVFLLAASIAVALFPDSSGWWTQGLIAAIPFFLLFLGMGVQSAGSDAFDGADAAEIAKDFTQFILLGAAVAAAGFVLGAGLSFAPVLAGAAGIVALGVLIAFTGAMALRGGLHTGDLTSVHVALSILGGFVAAGLILLSNWAVATLAAAG